MATLSIRQKLMIHLADADDGNVKAIYALLKNDIQEKNTFTLSKGQLQILDEERELHLSGKSKSYSRKEAAKIIKGERIIPAN